MSRRPPISTDGWIDKKLFFDGNTGLVLPQRAVLAWWKRLLEKSFRYSFGRLVRDEFGQRDPDKGGILLCHDCGQSRWLEIWK